MPEDSLNHLKKEDDGDDNPELSHIVKRNIQTIITLHEKTDQERNSHDRIADWVTSLYGRMSIVYVHIIFISIWILLNTAHLGFRVFDRNPFGLLNTIVSLEAIIVTTLVLISQNRLSEETKHRADLDLQMGLLTEHELTRALQMLDTIQSRIGIKPNLDGVLEDLEMETKPEDVLAELERMENLSLDRKTP
jgi:uncharacterized membrane protein